MSMFSFTHTVCSMLFLAFLPLVLVMFSMLLVYVIFLDQDAVIPKLYARYKLLFTINGIVIDGYFLFRKNAETFARRIDDYPHIVPGEIIYLRRSFAPYIGHRVRMTLRCFARYRGVVYTDAKGQNVYVYAFTREGMWKLVRHSLYPQIRDRYWKFIAPIKIGISRIRYWIRRDSAY